MNRLLHKKNQRSRAGLVTAIVIGMVLLLPGLAMAVNPNSTTTTTDQTLNIQIDTPTDGAVVPAATDLGITGKVGIDSLATSANVVYVADVSGSTENLSFNPPQDLVSPAGIGAEDDCNADGVLGSALDAECFGLIALNESLSATNVSVGLVVFGDGAQTADIDPTAGLQAFISPPNADNGGLAGSDVEEVVRSMDVEFSSGTSGVGKFTNFITPGFGFATNYDAALTTMNTAVAGAPSADQTRAFFLSDGTPTVFTTGVGSPLESAQAAGTVIDTFALGTIAPGECDLGRPLRQIADATGGTCTEVANPATLAAALTGVTPAGIDKVEVSFDGGTPVVASLDALGNFSTTVPGALLTPGTHTIEATVFATDGTFVTADIEVIVEGSTATINVVKLVDDDPDGVFDNDASGWTFQVRKVGTGIVDSDVTVADGLLSFEVDAGDDYRVREDAGPAGMWWASWSCVDDDTAAVLDSGEGLIPVVARDLDLVSDQSITCTFENQLLAGFMTGGGQITDDNNGDLKKKDLEKISFGGNVGIKLDGSLHGQWQANLHNVSDDTLDKGNFHSTSIDRVVFRDLDQFEDPAPPEALWNFIRFDATGRFNGEDGWSVTVRATDTGEPGNGKNAGDDTDSIRIQLYDPAGVLVYDSLTDFPGQQQARHNLDHGNIQIHPAE